MQYKKKQQTTFTYVCISFYLDFKVSLSNLNEIYLLWFSLFPIDEIYSNFYLFLFSLTFDDDHTYTKMSTIHFHLCCIIISYNIQNNEIKKKSS